MTFVIIAVTALVFVFIAIVASGNSKSHSIEEKAASPLTGTFNGKASRSTGIKVSIRELDRMMKSGPLPTFIRDLTSESILTGRSYIVLSESENRQLKEAVSQNVLRQAEWNTLYKLKAEAQGLEKSGNLQAAFESYSNLLRFAASSKTLASNNYSHDVNRLRIVSNKLRRQADFETLIHSLGIPNPNPKSK